LSLSVVLPPLCKRVFGREDKYRLNRPWTMT
jgi:hypothetical protein